MTKIHYKIIPHDGGWAYSADGVFSEPFKSRRAAIHAAHRVAHEQRVPGETAYIMFQDEAGEWHTETARGDDRPEADVEV